MTDRSQRERDRQFLRQVGGYSLLGGGLGAFMGGVSSGVQGAVIGGSIGVGIIPCALGTGVGGLLCREQYLRSIGLDSRTLRVRRDHEQSERVHAQMAQRSQDVDIDRNVIVFENPDETYYMSSIPQSRQTATFINPLRNPPVQEFEEGEIQPAEQEVQEVTESYKKGGFVKRTGLAKVHRGEYVVPRSKIKKCNVCK